MKEYKYREYLANVFPCLYYGIFCGALTGCIIFFFKLLAKYAEEISRYIYSEAKGNTICVLAVFAFLAICGIAMWLLHKYIPEVKGGGIPRSEGILRGVLSFRWLKTLIGTFFGSMVSFICGLPLGSEGPAVLMGTSVGSMCGCVSKNKSTWNRYVMTGGAGAGFAVATGAPLSGILFALEEIHKRFTPMLVLTVSTSVLSATYVNRLLCSAFGISPNLMSIEALKSFELDHVGYLLALGIIIALAVGVFDASIRVFGNIMKRFKRAFAAPTKLVLMFLITGVLAFTFTDGVYSGHHTMIELALHDKNVWFLLSVFAVRLVMMLFITDSGATGGIFIPTLAIGAAVSALCGKLLVVMGLPNELFATVVFLGMCAFIGGTLRAPLTAAVLFLELTGTFTNLFYVAVVIFTVNFITELLNQKPFYDIALESMEHAQNAGREVKIDCFEMKVSHGSFVVGKAVRDIMWPSSSVVISVKRADENRKDMDNDGEKKLYVGDTLVLRAKYFDEDEIKQLLFGLVGTEHDITKTTV